MTRPVTATELAMLLDQHANSLRLFAAQWSDSPDDSVQEAFVELAGREDSPDRPVAWLYRVVRNRALNELRGKKRRISREQAVAKSEQNDFDPATRMQQNEEQLQLQQRLQELPVESRELIVLRIWSGMKWKEIAELTGCSASSAQRRYVAALAVMKESLESKCLTKPK